MTTHYYRPKRSETKEAATEEQLYKCEFVDNVVDSELRTEEGSRRSLSTEATAGLTHSCVKEGQGGAVSTTGDDHIGDGGYTNLD